MNVTDIKKLLSSIADVMQENRENLIQLDSVVGDGDLGLTMSDGFLAAANYACVSEEKDVGKLLFGAGKTMSTAVPSTMGTLMASGLMQAGKALKGKETFEESDILTMLLSYEEGVMHRGKAKIGDKTFLDGFHPGVLALQSGIGHIPFSECAKNAYEASIRGYDQTKGMLAIHGRAATRGEASRELKDPGAYVGMLLMKSLHICFA